MAIGPRPPDVFVALDNDVLNDWRFRKPATVAAITDYISLVKAPPALTSTTIFEMLHGFEKAAVLAGAVNERLTRDREYAQRLIKECTVLPFIKRLPRLPPTYFLDYPGRSAIRSGLTCLSRPQL